MYVFRYIVQTQLCLAFDSISYLAGCTIIQQPPVIEVSKVINISLTLLVWTDIVDSTEHPKMKFVDENKNS